MCHLVVAADEGRGLYFTSDSRCIKTGEAVVGDSRCIKIGGAGGNFGTIASLSLTQKSVPNTKQDHNQLCKRINKT